MSEMKRGDAPNHHYAPRNRSGLLRIAAPVSVRFLSKRGLGGRRR